jgi:hypothetical protein
MKSRLETRRESDLVWPLAPTSFGSYLPGLPGSVASVLDSRLGRLKMNGIIKRRGLDDPCVFQPRQGVL